MPPGVSANVQGAARNASEVSGSIHDAAQGMKTISNGISGVADRAKEMARASNEAAQGVNEVARNVVGVSTAAQEIDTGAASVDGASGELAELACRQQELVSRFKIDQNAAPLPGNAPAEMSGSGHSTDVANAARETSPAGDTR